LFQASLLNETISCRYASFRAACSRA
jgi:hypothetical protein